MLDRVGDEGSVIFSELLGNTCCGDPRDEQGGFEEDSCWTNTYQVDVLATLGSSQQSWSAGCCPWHFGKIKDCRVVEQAAHSQDLNLLSINEELSPAGEFYLGRLLWIP